MTRNYSGVADSLATRHQATVALVPSYPWMSERRPQAVGGLDVENRKISWEAPAATGTADDVNRFVVYRFDSPESVDISLAEAIVAVTPHAAFEATAPGVYVVTALSRANNESEASVPVVVR